VILYPDKLFTEGKPTAEQAKFCTALNLNRPAARGCSLAVDGLANYCHQRRVDRRRKLWLALLDTS
jgi:hypothetical protein